jgi:ergothioneine biosynthesis protein EgtB
MTDLTHLLASLRLLVLRLICVRGLVDASEVMETSITRAPGSRLVMTSSSALRVPPTDTAGCQIIIDQYRSVRHFTEELCRDLEPEDMVVQTFEEVSPTKWHLAHTSWFFETFILRQAMPDYENPVPEYAYLFNSYYQAAGPMHCRGRRGLISRPTVAEVFAYRSSVDDAMHTFLSGASDEERKRWLPVVITGLHHEQQHQELLLTDIKHVFSLNPLKPVYREMETLRDGGDGNKHGALGWIDHPGGLLEIGYTGEDFYYDNEGPRHRRFLEPFQLADRLVTNGEYLAFMEDGGYRRSEFWLSLGWTELQQEGWIAPLYWEQSNGRWQIFTLRGLRDLDLNEPVCHVSLFEAAAYARWARARLPDEAEWEVAVRDQPISGNFVDHGQLHPVAVGSREEAAPVRQAFGDVWEWTRSSYGPYPGYEAAFGALGEYNGKFMCNQYVLRGGSCATSLAHIRPSYRNFFPPGKRWQFSGIRLARDLA